MELLSRYRALPHSAEREACPYPGQASLSPPASLHVQIGVKAVGNALDWRGKSGLAAICLPLGGKWTSGDLLRRWEHRAR